MNNKYRKIGYVLVSLILLLAVGIVVVRAQDGQTQSSNFIFIPGVYKDPAWHSITGQVLNPQNVPISGVTIQTDQGQVATTDQNGDYSILGLGEGVYTIIPSMGGTVFSPASSVVVIPPDVTKLNFTAEVGCSEAIVNGGFENNTGWEIPTTEYSAAYSTAEAHSGSRSMRTGIVNLADNKFSYSSTRQKVTIPAGTTSAYLTFWIKPFSGAVGLALPIEPMVGMPFGAAVLSGDVQYVLVLDNNGNIIKPLIWQLSDSRTWIQYQFNLVAYAGQTIWLHFGTFNDGLNGISSMFVDDVSLSICPGGGSPTPTPTAGPCGNLFHNPSFETVSDWEIPITAYPAGYSTAQKHTGSWSMRTGILNSADNKYSYSDFRQKVTIPSGASIATARFWLYTLSSEPMNLAPMAMIPPTGQPFSETALSSDLQYVLVLDQYQNWIDTLVWQRTADGYWHYYEFDLRRYAGRTIYLQFGTYNDGANGVTSMFVDDVSLDNCVTIPTPGPSPTPTRTPTPIACQELFVNNKFDGTTGWEIPLTRYPAGYSTALYHSPFRSMRTGIVNQADNTYSYSDFRQVVTIPSNSNHLTLSMWIYPISGESAGLSLPPEPAIGQSMSDVQMSGDVQYLLVLDSNFNIIKTLIWQRTNTQVWTNIQFDLSNYAGWKIMLQWGTYNDGLNGITSMFVDDVTFQACP